MGAQRHIEPLRTFIMYFLYAHCYTKETKLRFSSVETCLPQKDDLHVSKTGRKKKCGNVVVNCDGSALLVLSRTIVFAKQWGHRSSSLKRA